MRSSDNDQGQSGAKDRLDIYNKIIVGTTTEPVGSTNQDTTCNISTDDGAAVLFDRSRGNDLGVGKNWIDVLNYNFVLTHTIAGDAKDDEHNVEICANLRDRDWSGGDDWIRASVRIPQDEALTIGTTDFKGRVFRFSGRRHWVEIKVKRTDGDV